LLDFLGDPSKLLARLDLTKNINIEEIKIKQLLQLGTSFLKKKF